MKKILLIDDNADFCLMIAKQLAGAGYEVESAFDAEAAMNAISSEQAFHAIIVDFWLGKENSLPILDRLSEKQMNTPVILVSGGDGKMSLEATKAVGDLSGVRHFLQKPFSKDELASVLASLDS
jgi:DNA-binding NtrC family response regulator